MFDGCHYDSSMDSGVVKVIDYNYIPDLKETFLMQVLATIGPTCVDVYSSGGDGDFDFYESGIYKDPSCFGTDCAPTFTKKTTTTTKRIGIRIKIEIF
jgi:hypothetical protein